MVQRTWSGRTSWGVLGLVVSGLGFTACGDDGTTPPPLDQPDASSGGPSAASTLAPTSAPGSSSPTSSTNGVPNGSSSTSTSSAPSATLPDGGVTNLPPATIETRLSTPEVLPEFAFRAFNGGSASATQLASLKYFIRSIQVCESLEVQGSGFQNAAGCLELYRGSESILQADPSSDFTPLADAARAVDEGYVDLVSPASRSNLTRATVLRPEHVRGYNYGIITWALPIKVTATVELSDGLLLYTHDGTTVSETLGADGVRGYFTDSSLSLLDAPAEEAVVLLGNGGNWFKFQEPFYISQADLEQGRNWVLDLVFNPDGIVKGYDAEYASGSLREKDDQGTAIRAISVPMIDLVPVPHRESDAVVRESYVAHVTLDGNGFDLRLELYSLENDPNQAVLGVDVKTLVTASTFEAPPEASKVATVGTDSGTLRFGSFNDSTLIGSFVRLQNVGDHHTAQIACATHADRAGAEGGALLVVNACPAALLDVDFRLESRARLDGSLSFGGNGSDAGVAFDAGAAFDAGDAALLPDAVVPVASHDAAAAPPSGDAAIGISDAALQTDAAALPPEMDAAFDAAADATP